MDTATLFSQQRQLQRNDRREDRKSRLLIRCRPWFKCSKDNVTKDDDWDSDACLLVIVDKISFINREDLEKMIEYHNLLNEKPSSNIYGDLPIILPVISVS